MFHFLIRALETRSGAAEVESSKRAISELQNFPRWMPERGVRAMLSFSNAKGGLCLALVLLGADFLGNPSMVRAEDQAAGVEVAAESTSDLGILYRALSRCRGRLTEAQRWQIAGAIDREARRHGYDPLFVQAMVEVESTCSPRARSGKGAMGLIQLRPTTARAVAKKLGLPWTGASALYDPEYNVRLGVHYLSQLHARFGDPHTAIAAYNLGPTRVARLGSDRVRNSRYVRRVLKRYEALLREHPRGPGESA